MLPVITIMITIMTIFFLESTAEENRSDMWAWDIMIYNKDYANFVSSHVGMWCIIIVIIMK